MLKRSLWIIGVVVVAVGVASGIRGQGLLKRGAGESGDALVGCGPIPVRVPYLLGRATVAEGVIGATVTIKDETGKTLLEVAKATEEGGAFHFPSVPGLPEKVRVEVSGGTHQGAPFQGVLASELEGFVPERDLVFVNPATTLAAVVRARAPSKSAREASAVAARVLGLPAGADLGTYLAFARQHRFDGHAFAAAWSRSGAATVQAFLEQVLAEFERTGVPQPFHPRSAVQGVASDVIKKMLEKLEEYGPKFAKELGKEFIFGELFGWLFDFVLERVGVGSDAKIIGLLEEIARQLETLHDDVMNGLNDLSFQQAEAGLRAPAKQIKRWFSRYTVVADLCTKHKGCNAADLAEYQSIMDYVRSSTSGLSADLDALDSNIMDGAAGSAGLYTAMANKYRGTHEDFILPWHPDIDRAAEYYTGIQLAGLRLALARRQHDLATDAGASWVPPPLDGGLDGSSLGPYAVADAEGRLADIGAQAARLKQLKQLAAPPGTILFRGKKAWLKAPISDISKTEPADRLGFVHPFEQVAAACAQLNQQRFAGLDRWHLPDDEELHDIVREAPEDNDTYEGGVFHWLKERGFELQEEGKYEPRGFTFPYSTYLSSYCWGPDKKERYCRGLWNSGISYACTIYRVPPARFDEECDFGNAPQGALGAWCVADYTPPAGAHHEALLGESTRPAAAASPTTIELQVNAVGYLANQGSLVIQAMDGDKPLFPLRDSKKRGDVANFFRSEDRPMYTHVDQLADPTQYNLSFLAIEDYSQGTHQVACRQYKWLRSFIAMHRKAHPDENKLVIKAKLDTKFIEGGDKTPDGTIMDHSTCVVSFTINGKAYADLLPVRPPRQ